MNKYFKGLRTLLLFTVLLLLTNCQDDEAVEFNRESVEDVSSKIVSLDELKNMHGFEGNFSNFKTKSGASNKKVYSVKYKFWVETGRILLTQKGNYHSLSFPIFRNQPDKKLENLFLHPYNGKYLPYLIKYDFDAKDLQNLKNGVAIKNILTKMEIIGLKNLDMPELGIDTASFGDSNWKAGDLIWHDGKCWSIDNVDLYDDGSWKATLTLCVGASCICAPLGAESNTPPGGHSFQRVDIRTWAGDASGGAGSGTGPGSGGGGGTPSSGPGSPGYGTVFNPNNGTPIDPAGPQQPGRTSPANGLPVIGVLGPDFPINILYSRLDNEQKAFWNATENRLIIDAIIEFIDENGTDEGINFAKEMVDMVMKAGPENGVGFNETETAALEMTLLTKSQGYFENPFDEDYYSLISPYSAVNLNSPEYALWSAYFTAHCAILKLQHPEWSSTRIYWEASKEMIHLGLDLIGLAPVVGEVADLANGVIYTIEGDGINASLSYASAIPVAGWAAAGVKFAKKTVDVTSTSKTTLKWMVKTGDIVTFGDRSQLRKILKLAPGDIRQAHHIIPWGKSTHPAIQKAAKSNKEFHMNEAFNGIPLNTAVHNGSHLNYDNNVMAKLNLIPANATPEQAYNKVLELVNNIRSAIIANPNTHINNLIF